MQSNSEKSPGQGTRVLADSYTPLLNGLVLLLGFAALLGAAWAGYSGLVALLGLWLSAGLVTKLWSKICLKGVSCERLLSERRVFPGDEVTVTLRVTNRKLLPLPWVEVRDQAPMALVPAGVRVAAPTSKTNGEANLVTSAAGKSTGAGTRPAERPGFVTLSRSTPLGWYSAASFISRLTATARGYHPLGPLSISSGDIFGLNPRTLVQPDVEHLIVYPRTFELAELGITSLAYPGEVKVRERMFEDPSRLLGVRSYVPGDSPRRIHWKSSAHSRTLQVKIFETATDLKVALFLAVDTFTELDQNDFELGISTAASVARHLLQKNVQTGLYVNTKLADTGGPACLGAGSGIAQLALILEALAKTTEQASGPFTDFFAGQRKAMGFGGTLVFVTGTVSPDISLLAADLVGSGRRALGFYLAGSPEKLAGCRGFWEQIREPGYQCAKTGDTAMTAV